MSVQQMSLVWESDLDPNLKLVALALADYADPDGWCSPWSIFEVADNTGYSLDQTKRIVDELVKVGFVVIDDVGSPDPSVTWRLHPEARPRVSGEVTV